MSSLVDIANEVNAEEDIAEDEIGDDAENVTSSLVAIANQVDEDDEEEMPDEIGEDEEAPKSLVQVARDIDKEAAANPTAALKKVAATLEDEEYADDDFDNDDGEDFEDDDDDDDPTIARATEIMMRHHKEPDAPAREEAKTSTKVSYPPEPTGINTRQENWKKLFAVKKPKNVKKFNKGHLQTLSRPKGSGGGGGGRNAKCSCTGEKRAKCSARKPNPGCRRALGTVAKADDVRNCTFKPKVRHSAAGGKAAEGDFLARMEAIEGSRRAAHEKARKEKEYAARQDKKVCPQCAAEQSYDEVVKRRKICTRCRLPYKAKTSWADVQKNFTTRLKKSEAKSAERSKAAAAKWTTFKPAEKKVYDAEEGRFRTVKPKKAKWGEVAGGFLARMEEQTAKKNQKLAQAQLEREQAELASAQPTVRARSSTSRTRTAAARSKALVGSFQDRVGQGGRTTAGRSHSRSRGGGGSGGAASAFQKAGFGATVSSVGGGRVRRTGGGSRSGAAGLARTTGSR